MVKRWLCGLMLAFTCLALAAQGAAPSEEEPRPQPDAASRRDTVRLFLVHRMRESLQLSDAQTLKVLDVLEALDKERQGHQDAMRSLQARLRAAVEDPATSESAFKDLVAETRKEQARFDTAARGLDERLLALMTPKQQAQYLILRRSLMDQIQQDQRQRPDKPSGRLRR